MSEQITWYDFPVTECEIEWVVDGSHRYGITEIKKDRPTSIRVGGGLIPNVRLKISLEAAAYRDDYLQRRCRIRGMTGSGHAFIGYIRNGTASTGPVVFECVTYTPET